MGALDGIKVIDLGVLVQAPQCCALLGDMGAEVVKVELPGIGDSSRWLPMAPDDFRSAWFLANNRGKRSMTCDLRTPRGREVFLELVARSDVLVSNFKPGTMEAWGLGYEELAAVNPGIIHAAGSAFGHLGPDAPREGADLAAQASAGIIGQTGTDAGEPTPIAVTICDHVAGLNLANGVLAALFHRTRTGKGQRIEVSLLGGQVWAQAAEYTFFLERGVNPGRANGGHPMIPGLYGVFPTSDGWIAVVGVVGAARDSFFPAIGRPDLADSPPILFGEQKAAVFAELADAFRKKPTAEWCQILSAAGQRYAPVRSYDEIVDDPQLRANGYLADVDGKTVVGPPIWFSDTPAVPHADAPELGQHTEEVLLELGYSWDDIAALREAGAI